MNLTQLESIFQSLNSHKSSPSSWTIDHIRSFCDHSKLEWAKDILRIHNKEKLNVDHLLLNNVLGNKRRNNEKTQDKFSLMDAQKLSDDVIKDTCMANQFFYKNYNDKNIHYQIVKLKIWSFVLNIYEANRMSLKRLQGLHRSRICTRGKCCRCSGPEGKCTCELLQDILMQINCYIRSVFILDHELPNRRNSDIYINSSLIKLILTNVQYLPKESPIFWDSEETCVLLKLTKMECLESLFKQNLIDGFIISVLGKCPFTETSLLLKLFDFSTGNSKIQNIRLQTHSKLTQPQKYTYIQSVFLMLFYVTNMLNQTIYNCLEIDTFQQENQQISRFNYFDLFYFKVKCPEVWRKSPDKKAQTIDNLATFKVFNLEDGRHESVALDNLRSNSVGQANNEQSSSTHKITNFQQSIQSSVRQRQDLIFCRKELEDMANHAQQIESTSTLQTESTPLLQESVYFPQQEERTMQESVYFRQESMKQQQLQESCSQESMKQQQMQESVYFPQQKQEQQQLQESVYFMTQEQQQNMKESVYLNQQDQQMQQSVQFTQMQESVCFQSPKQQYQMQQSVVFQQMQQSVVFQQQIGQSVVMGQSVAMNDQSKMGQSIAIDKIVNDAMGNSVRQRNQPQAQEPQKKEPIRTPTRLKRQKQITTIEKSSMNTVFRNPFILQVSHQLRLRSEQFQKILTVSLIGSTFGRSQDNQYVLQDQSKISSKHARIIVVNDRFHVQDLGSKRGTFLNATKLRLQKSMMFYVGDKQAFQIMDLNEKEGNIVLGLDKDSLDQKQIHLKIGESWSIGRDIKRTNYQYIGYPLHQSLSMIHCIITYANKDGEPKFILDDQNSKNGTWLRLSDKKIISEPQLLFRNSRFNLAFEIQYEVIDVYYNNNQ